VAGLNIDLIYGLKPEGKEIVNYGETTERTYIN
jgi:hypothetical protein